MQGYRIVESYHCRYSEGGKNVMSTTVNTSFAEFMKDHVDLDPEDTKNARSSI